MRPGVMRVGPRSTARDSKVMAHSLDELEKAVASHSNPLAYLPLAEELRKRRLYDRALTVCEHGLKTTGPSVRGYTILGKIQFDLQHYNLAAEAYRRAVEMAPGSYEPTLLLAKSLSMKCEYFEARELVDGLLMSYPRDPEVRQLRRILETEIHSATGERARFDAMESGEFGAEDTPSLVTELEETPGVRAVFLFGLRTVKGDVFFDEEEGHELDEDIKVAILESYHLATKLNFGTPSLITFDSHSGRLILRVQEQQGLLAITKSDVMLGKLRFLMDQILRARRRT